jgi:hypothetical protein
MTFFFPTVNRSYQHITGKTKYGLLFMHELSVPLQGLFNFLIYRRQYVLKLRAQYPDVTWWEIIKEALVVSWFKTGNERRALSNSSANRRAANSLSRNTISRDSNHSQSKEESAPRRHSRDSKLNGSSASMGNISEEIAIDNDDEIDLDDDVELPVRERPPSPPPPPRVANRISMTGEVLTVTDYGNQGSAPYSSGTTKLADRISMADEFNGKEQSPTTGYGMAGRSSIPMSGEAKFLQAERQGSVPYYDPPRSSLPISGEAKFLAAERQGSVPYDDPPRSSLPMKFLSEERQGSVPYDYPPRISMPMPGEAKYLAAESQGFVSHYPPPALREATSSSAPPPAPSSAPPIVVPAEPVSNEYYCPITRKLFKDPVVAPDGKSYERSAILATGRYSKEQLYPNIALQAIVWEVLIARSGIDMNIPAVETSHLPLTWGATQESPNKDIRAMASIAEDKTMAKVEMASAQVDGVISNGAAGSAIAGSVAKAGQHKSFVEEQLPPTSAGGASTMTWGDKSLAEEAKATLLDHDRAIVAIGEDDVVAKVDEASTLDRGTIVEPSLSEEQDTPNTAIPTVTTWSDTSLAEEEKASASSSASCTIEPDVEDTTMPSEEVPSTPSSPYAGSATPIAMTRYDKLMAQLEADSTSDVGALIPGPRTIEDDSNTEEEDLAIVAILDEFSSAKEEEARSTDVGTFPVDDSLVHREEEPPTSDKSEIVENGIGMTEEDKVSIAEEEPSTPDEDFSMASFVAKAVEDGTIIANGIAVNGGDKSRTTEEQLPTPDDGFSMASFIAQSVEESTIVDNGIAMTVDDKFKATEEEPSTPDDAFSMASFIAKAVEESYTAENEGVTGSCNDMNGASPVSRTIEDDSIAEEKDAYFPEEDTIVTQSIQVIGAENPIAEHETDSPAVGMKIFNHITMNGDGSFIGEEKEATTPDGGAKVFNRNSMTGDVIAPADSIHES